MQNFHFHFFICFFFSLLQNNSTSNDKSALCIHCWKWTRFFGGWRLSLPYVALGVALLMWPHNLWLSYVGGVQLIILALMRMFTIFRTSNMRGRGASLLPEFDDQNDKLVHFSSSNQYLIQTGLVSFMRQFYLIIFFLYNSLQLFSWISYVGTTYYQTG